jgi:hypothetical protein
MEGHGHGIFTRESSAVPPGQTAAAAARLVYSSASANVQYQASALWPPPDGHFIIVDRAYAPGAAVR